MVTFEDLTAKLRDYIPNFNEKRVRQAFDFASEAHQGQKRYSGEPYIIHPLHTAYYLADFHPDEDTVVAALLHDVLEDTDRKKEEIEKKFGKNVTMLAVGMEKVGRVRAGLDQTQAENLQKMFIAMAQDVRIILIKLCDRLHNIRTLEFVPKEKQLRIAKETLDIYAPIASSLGIYRLKIALEDAAFRFVHPEEAHGIEEQLKSSEKYREEYIAQVNETLKSLLAEEGISCEVNGRVKSSYSIFTKMHRKKKTSLSEIFDIFAMRIILENVLKQEKEYVGHIYAALGIIHSHFTPLAHRFKDYIAIPKVNGYRSLHTTVIGLGPKIYTNPTEIQIRSRQMHDQAEFGIASHWFYEVTKGASASYPPTASLQKQLEWIKRLSGLKEAVSNKDEYFENLQIDIFQDRIFVFTPRGQVKDLPKGATPVDFAYTVHTEIGNRGIMAKVNGNIVPLNYELKNGEVVEIVTRQNAAPNRQWLTFVKTQQAKSHIRSFFKNEDRAKNLKDGKELVNEYLVKIGKPLLAPDLQLLKEYMGKRLTLNSREDLLVEVGKGTLLTSALVKRLFAFEDIVTPRRGGLKKAAMNTDPKQIFIGGEPNLPHRFAKCCKPKETDTLMGYVTGLGEVSVHRSNCRASAKRPKNRLQPVSFSMEKSYTICIAIDVEDRIGLVRDLGNLVAQLGIKIIDIVSNRLADGQISKWLLRVEIQNYGELEKLFQHLENIPGVKQSSLMA